MDYNQPNLNEIISQYNKYSKTEQQQTYRFYRPPLGTEKITLRFLPPWNKEGRFAKLISYHYSIPNTPSILCYRTHDLECKLCNFLEQNAHKMNLETFAAKVKCYMNILVIHDPTQNLQRLPYIFSGGLTDYKYIYNLLINEKTNINFFHPIKGHNTYYQREKPSGRFSRQTALNPSPIADTEEEIKEILANIYNLDDIWRRPDERYDEKVNAALQELERYVNKNIELFEEKVTQPTTVINPNNKPICFKHYQKSEKCSLCPFEFECME